MYVAFIIGTAGSGKSLLTASFLDWLKLKQQDTIAVNLDPGAVSLPYTPDVDVRNYVSVDSVMKNFELGPNGALVMAADLIADHIQDLKEDIEEQKPDYVLVDTPGQIELFAFRASGPYITNELTEDPRAILYLFDASFSVNPLNYVSNMFLATAVYNRFFFPQIYVLSKTDLLSKREVKKILSWGSKIGALEETIEKQLSDTKRILSREIAQVISNLGLTFQLVPVSAKEQTGFINLHAIITRIFSGGEEMT